MFHLLFLACTAPDDAGTRPTGTTTTGTTTAGTTATGTSTTGTTGTSTTGTSTTVGRTTVGDLVFEGPLPRNLLIVTLDTFRKDALGLVGGFPEAGGPSVTPSLDAFLLGSHQLVAHRSTSNWTLPAVIALYAGQSHVDLQIEPVSQDPAVAQYPTVPWSWWPAVLRDAGWTTILVNANKALDEWLTGGKDARGGAFDPGFTDVRFEAHAPASWIVDQTLEAIQAAPADRPWLANLQVFDPHMPFEAPSPWSDGLAALDPIPFDLTQESDVWRMAAAWPTLDAEDQEAVRTYAAAAYLAEVAYADNELGRLFAGLEASGQLAHTLVLVWTDHGEQFWEHGRFMHDVSMNREEVDLFAAFRAPGLQPGTTTSPTSQVDLVATLAAALGQPAHGTWTGALPGTAPTDRELLAFRYKAREVARVALDQGGRRLIYEYDGGRAYYRADMDPAEATDLYDPADADVQAMWARLQVHLDAIAAYLPHVEPVDPGP